MANAGECEEQSSVFAWNISSDKRICSQCECVVPIRSFTITIQNAIVQLCRFLCMRNGHVCTHTHSIDSIHFASRSLVAWRTLAFIYIFLVSQTATNIPNEMKRNENGLLLAVFTVHGLRRAIMQRNAESNSQPNTMYLMKNEHDHNDDDDGGGGDRIVFRRLFTTILWYRAFAWFGFRRLLLVVNCILLCSQTKR